MITAKDIRIGNKLFYFTDVEEWVECVLDWQDLKWCEQFNKQFNAVHKPLPLTPELLDKCGFTTDGITYGIKVPNMRLRLFGMGKYNVTLYQTHVKNGVQICRVEYFHHLQNIIYDLCDIELTL